MFLNSFGVNVRDLLTFGRGPSQNPQKLTLAALKFGVGNVKNRRFQLGLVRFLLRFYRNTHREPLNTTTKGFGLEPRRSIQVVSRLKSVSRQYQLVRYRHVKLLLFGFRASGGVCGQVWWWPSCCASVVFGAGCIGLHALSRVFRSAL